MSDMKYVRLFAGPDGESNFEDVAVKFSSEPPLRFLVLSGCQLSRLGSSDSHRVITELRMSHLDASSLFT